MHAYRQDFIRFAVAQNVLRFGEFQTKAGRLSPYFFNSGLFQDGAALRELCQFYAQAILASEVPFDMLFGPAYKGIPLVAGTSIALAEQGSNVPYCFNRKEAKDHGEGGNLVGAPLKGKVLIVDDVITAGTAVREAVSIIRAAGAEPVGLVIALDRQERGQGTLSAVREVEQEHGLMVVAIVRLAELTDWLVARGGMQASLDSVRAYREQYGA
jgi:orotate phosphoribosyltransferase